MKSSTDIGMNRTGTATSPRDAKEMAEAAMNARVPPGDESEIAQVRSDYASRGDRVGTMPPPTSVKGAVKTAGKMMKGQKPAVLLDKLGERLAFERTGSRLYEAIITKVMAQGGGSGAAPDIGLLRENQRQEMEHMDLLVDALVQMGADPTVQTPCADVAGVQSLGLIQVATDPRTSISQCLNALLTAELVDTASWEMLVELTEESGNDELANEFRRALAEEAVHLSRVRAWLTEATRAEAHGQGATA